MIRLILSGSQQYTEDSFHHVNKTIDVDSPGLQKILENKIDGIQFVTGAEIVEKCPDCKTISPVEIISASLSKQYKCGKCAFRWSFDK